MAAAALTELEPALVWERFAELTQIARPSKAEGPAREHVLAWAGARSLEACVDPEGNVVVSVPAEVQRERVLGRPGMTPAKLDRILERQLPDSEKRARADFVISTAGPLEETRRAVRRILACLTGGADS